MTAQVVKGLTDPVFLIALLVGIAVFATFFTLMPSLAGNTLKSRMKSVALERDVKELRKANEILKLASAFFAQAELDRRFKS